MKNPTKTGIIQGVLQTFNAKSQNTKIGNHWGKGVKKNTKTRHNPSSITDFECKIYKIQK